MERERTYLAIDLKSFYASVECVERGLDPLTTHLVVADPSRTEKTICLAVSPSLKAYGIPGRARLFEVVRKMKEVNALRLASAPGRRFTGSSRDAGALKADPSLSADYITATPRMAHYVACSAKIYQIYLKYAAPEDIHVYSIDEVFLDATAYLRLTGLSPQAFASAILREVLKETGITATAGIGTNLYLCKVAMDIVAKHVEPDRNGVRIARLDEDTYRRLLWGHRPLTDFWRVGRGYAARLEQHGLRTMGDVARCSLENEALLYRLFGVNAELLIDHAWGWEPCTLADIKAYRPEERSIGSGQVLQKPYSAEKGRLVAREMADQLALDLVDRGLVTDRLILTVGYDAENLADAGRREAFRGGVTTDHYGRAVPRHAHGTADLGGFTSSTARILEGVTALYDRIVDPSLLVRRLNLTACRVLDEGAAAGEAPMEQLDLFTPPEVRERQTAQQAHALAREKRRQRAVLDIKRKFGKNAILRGMDLEDGATAMDRNRQIGGHRA